MSKKEYKVIVIALVLLICLLAFNATYKPEKHHSLQYDIQTVTNVVTQTNYNNIIITNYATSFSTNIVTALEYSKHSVTNYVTITNYVMAVTRVFMTNYIWITNFFDQDISLYFDNMRIYQPPTSIYK